MKISVKVILFEFLLLSVISSNATNVLTNCTKKEKVFFSCTTKKKIISFCASLENRKPAYLEYRFGVPNKIELSYKASDEDLNKTFSRADVLGANNSSTVIWFTNKDIIYLLDDAIKGGTALEIIKNKKKIAEIACRKNYYGDTTAPSKFIKDKKQKDFFELYGIDTEN